MNDIWFGSDLSHRDLDGIFRSLSLLGREPSLLAIADDGARLVLASRNLFKLFEADTEASLSDRLLRGQDPGSRRLVALAQQLALDGAPRLERLRFFVGPRSEVVTFLCRRIHVSDGQPLFVAAALGLPDDCVPETPEVGVPERGSAMVAARADGPAREEPPPALPSTKPVGGGMSVQAILAMLRTRWPSSRSIRFLWQADADLVCTEVTSPLADIVGTENADLVGRSLPEIAPRLDATGRLRELLVAEKTWSGVDVLWPVADASAAVEVGLGAVPIFDRDHLFEGYRGYGVIRLDRVVAHDPVRLRSVVVPRPVPAGNIVTFPGATGEKALSPEDQQTFQALGAELRDKAGVPRTPMPPIKASPQVSETPPEQMPQESVAPQDEPLPAVPHIDPEPAPSQPVAAAIDEPAPAAEATSLSPGRAEDVARNAGGLLDRLTLALLVSRDNIPIYANRCFFDLTGFADEDDLHEAGGLTHLFGGLPGNNSGAESVCVRARDGTIVVAAARMQRTEWDGLPATLLTLHHVPEPAGPQADAPNEEPALPGIGDAASGANENESRELRAILETATDGVVVIDGLCNVVSLNRSGEALFGCDRATVVGKPFLDLFASDNQGLAADYFEGLKSSATKSLLNDGREIMIKAHQGGAIPVFMTLGRLGPSDGNASDGGDGAAGMLRFCALFRDLTPWKKVERELEGARQDAERASALKSDFLARVSHEVRTPLTAIIGFAETMLEERFGPVGNDRYKEYLRDIQASGSHVVSLVNDLLDLSKIEAGKMDFALDPLEVNRIVGDSVALMQPQASRERVIMRLSLAPNMPQIRADERALRQIVLNILSNAVKYNEPGGQVIVATAVTEAGCVVIRIRDTGPGMSDEDVATALQPFRQLATVRSVTPGTGLGLPLTKALVEANEATFAIRSKPTQGTLIEVSFPPARVMARQGNA